jgi:hypothetical protein
MKGGKPWGDLKNLDDHLGVSSKVVELPSLGSSNEGITITYFHKNKSSNLHMS